MTMVNCGVFEWPRSEFIPGVNSTGGSAAVLSLDSTTDMLAWVGEFPITDNITKVYFRTGAIPPGGGDTVDVRIETVTNGKPSGTLWATDTNAAVAIDDTDDNLWKTATLTAAASGTLGDRVAIVIRSSSGSPNINLLGTTAVTQGAAGMHPTLVQNSTGADAVITDPMQLEWIVEFSSAGIRYMPGLSPLSDSLTLTAFNSGSSPNARALRFQVPFKCRAVGARIMLGNFAAGSNFTVSLFDATGDTDAEALAQCALDGDFAPSTTADGQVEVWFDDRPTLSAATTYYVEVRPDTANSLTLFEVPTGGTGAPANAIKCFSHQSTELYLATRTWTAGTAGAWSTSTTVYPGIQLLIDQVDDGAGSGGGANRAALPAGLSSLG